VTDYADVAIVEDAIATWPTEFIRCRAWRHQWEPLTAVIYPAFSRSTQLCQRCGATRWQEARLNGVPFHPWVIEPPEGYSIKGLGRMGPDGRAAVNLAAMHTGKVHRQKANEAPRSERTKEELDRV
jgi:hypothetical protein